MTYQDLTQAEVIADTIYDGVRLTTMRVTFPRFILAEFNTHRVFSRNSASSRAIPTRRQVSITHSEPYIPGGLMYNQSGMQATELMTPEDEAECQSIIREMLDFCALGVDRLARIGGRGLHKQWAARYIEPWAMHTVIVSSTEWENFFAQRDHEDAQPEMQTLAREMRAALEGSHPDHCHLHIPFIHAVNGSAEWDEESMITAVAHCARVSYGREMEEKTYEEDAALVERLIRSGHWSPFEHVGIAGREFTSGPEDYDSAIARHLGNFDYPWRQLRHRWREHLPSIAARLK